MVTKTAMFRIKRLGILTQSGEHQKVGRAVKLSDKVSLTNKPEDVNCRTSIIRESLNSLIIIANNYSPKIFLMILKSMPYFP